MPTKRPTKKTLRVQIAKSLAENFENLKEGIGSKKFDRNIRKASKALLSGVKSIKEIKPELKSQKKVKSDVAVTEGAAN